MRLYVPEEKKNMMSLFHRQGFHTGQRAASETRGFESDCFKMILATQGFSLLLWPVNSLMSWLPAAPGLTRSGSSGSTLGRGCSNYCVIGAAFLPAEAILKPLIGTLQSGCV